MYRTSLPIIKLIMLIVCLKEPDATSERYKICISHVDNGLGWILSRFYVEAAFSAKAKALGDQIVSDIRQQFIARVKTLEWMDDETKKVAIDKATSIIQKIGYPTAVSLLVSDHSDSSALHLLTSRSPRT